jgi:hypothetical protein
MKVANPYFSLAGALDFLNAALWRFDSGKPGPTLWIPSALGRTRVGPLCSGGAPNSGLTQLAMTALCTLAVHPANVIWVGCFLLRLPRSADAVSILDWSTLLAFRWSRAAPSELVVFVFMPNLIFSPMLSKSTETEKHLVSP